MDKYEQVEAEQKIDRPQLTIDILADQIRKLKRKPEGMPADPMIAAKWWVRMQKRPDEKAEAPNKVAVFGSTNQQRWITPYADRLKDSLMRFCALTRDQQKFVLAAAEDKVFYNGDEFELFRKVYDETMLMRKMGVEKYREQALSKYGALVKEVDNTNK